MTVQSEDSLNALLPDNQQRLITPAVIREFNESVFAVGGLMMTRALDGVKPASGWQEFVWMDRSSDTKGIQEDLSRGVFTIDDLSGAVPPGDASGSYVMDAIVSVIPTVDCGLRLGFNIKGVLDPDYRQPDFTFCPAGVLTTITPLTGGARFNANQEGGLAINSDTDFTIGPESVRISMAQFKMVRQ
jgi:hypothetical protein